MSHKKGRIDEKGRDCNDPDHVGERYLPWDKFHKQERGTNGRNSRCGACIRRNQKIFRAKGRKEKAVKPKFVTPTKSTLQDECNSNWDANAAADFLSRRK